MRNSTNRADTLVTNAQRWWRNVRSFLVWLSTGEALPRTENHLATPPHRTLVDVARWLLAADQLPPADTLPAGTARATGGLVRWLLSTETLPKSPSEDATRTGSFGELARWLLTPEQLPKIDTDAAVSRQRTLTWLFTSEPLPPPTDESTTSKRREV
jgi:hypothetical protein